MDGRLGDQALPPTTRLRPKLLGRGLPLPPVVILVAAVGVLAGLALGYGLGSTPGRAPASPTWVAASTAASPSPSVSAPQSAAPAGAPTPSSYELPPAGGLTLTEALAALNRLGWGISPAAIISARVEQYGDASPSLVDGRPDEWVLAIVVRGTFMYGSCGRIRPSPAP